METESILGNTLLRVDSIGRIGVGHAHEKDIVKHERINRIFWQS